MNATSPLSSASKVRKLDSISVPDIEKHWKEKMGIDISFEFKGVNEIGFYECAQSGLRFFYPVIAGSERLYEALQQFDWYYLEDKNEYGCAKKHVKPGDRILEVGCGKAAFSKLIPECKYVGLELSGTAAAMAHSSGIDVRKESIQNHSRIENNNYDVVCAFQVLEHVSDVRSFIKACVNCVKPGGRLIYSVPSADSYIALLKNSILNMPPHHVTHWPDSSLRYLAKEFSLSEESIEHESLANIHARQYASLLCEEAINNMLGLKQKLLDRSLRRKLISRVASIGGSFLRKGLNDERSRPRGHSVTAVYRKESH